MIVVPRSELGPNDSIDSLISKGSPRRVGPHFDALVEAVDWELRAKIAMGVLGEIHPNEQQIHDTAVFVADQVDWQFRLSPRVPPGEDQAPDADSTKVEPGGVG
jgi:hypothetical protein